MSIESCICLSHIADSQTEGLRHDTLDLLRNIGGLPLGLCLVLVQIVDQHDKFVAAESRHGVDLSHTTCQPSRNLDQERISDRMSMSVIH